MESLTQALKDLVEHLGYGGIFLATLIESTFVPIPAEVTMIPAGMLVAQGVFNYWGVLAASTMGVIVGSLLNYLFGYYFGRSLLLKYGKYIFIKHKHIHKTERFFKKFGWMAAFTGRLLPGLRHYIAFVAGIAKMPVRPFMGATALGGLIWMWILLQVGFMAQLKAEKNGEADVTTAMEIAVAVILVITGIAYFVKVRMMRHHHDEEPHDPAMDAHLSEKPDSSSKPE